jgi:hypothetical protein
MRGWLWEKVELKSGKHWNIGKAMAYLYASIKIPHAKVTREKVTWVESWFLCGVVWARGGVDFDRQKG